MLRRVPIAAPRRVLASQLRFTRVGPTNRLIRSFWHRAYPELGQERWRDMYHSYYPYLFDHGDKMSLYPKIPSNPREWQPNQLLTTYDAIREDKYDAFIRLREKFPELYQDTQQWDNPVPFGEYNMFYSRRFGMIGTKLFTTVEFDDLGNKMELTALWCPDNQVVAHRPKDQYGGYDKIQVGATNVPVEFHKPYVTAVYKSQQVPVKHVSISFDITPDAFVPVGTRLDVRHFRPGQELDLFYQETDYGFQGPMFRLGADGGPVWLGDHQWQRRIGNIGQEGASRVFPGKVHSGQTGRGVMAARSRTLYRIDFKNALLYVTGNLECDIGAYVKISDIDNIHTRVPWNVSRGFPPFPTFIAPPDEDLSTLTTDECQLISEPLHRHFHDEPNPTAMISQQEIEDTSRSAPTPVVEKKKSYDYHKWQQQRRELRKAKKAERAKTGVTRRAIIAEKQQETMRRKYAARRRVK